MKEVKKHSHDFELDRLDISCLSQQDLLVLEEIMGHMEVSEKIVVSKLSDLPKSKFKKNREAKSYECPICTEEFNDGDIVTTLPCCHVFHSKEIDDWLNMKSTKPKCPLCQHQVH